MMKCLRTGLALLAVGSALFSATPGRAQQSAASIEAYNRNWEDYKAAMQTAQADLDRMRAAPSQAESCGHLGQAIEHSRDAAVALAMMRSLAASSNDQATVDQVDRDREKLDANRTKAREAWTRLCEKS